MSELKQDEYNDNGFALLYGINCEVNTVEAVKCFIKAINLGSARGMSNLGFCFENGLGVDRDLSLSTYWYYKAADQGHSMAQNNLGDIFIQTGDLTQGVYWLQKSAEQDNVWGLTNLAMCFLNGDGVVQSENQAAALYMRAAELGDSFAQYSIGVCYFQGIGVEQDLSKAIEWFKKAAEQGDENAIYNLSELNVKQCPTCMKWDTIYSQRRHNGIEDMVVCINEDCPDYYVVYSYETKQIISGKECPECGSNRTPLNAGAWTCWNTGCPLHGEIDRRF